MQYQYKQQGLTLIELIIVIAIIGVLAGIAYPSYQNSVKKTKRTDAMAELQNIASQIEAQKVAKGSYSTVNTTNFVGNFPKQGAALYTISISSPLTSEWEITATPLSGQMSNDGLLTLNNKGIKCRVKSATEKMCGTNDEFNK